MTEISTIVTELQGVMAKERILRQEIGRAHV